MEESKVVDLKVDEEAAKDILISSTDGNNEQESAEDVDSTSNRDSDAVAASSATKKKKSKKAKLKQVLGAKGKDDWNKETSDSSANPASKLTSGMVEQLLEMNPSLKSEVAGMDKEKATETVKKMDVADLLTGMVCLVEILREHGLNRFTVSEWEKSEGHGILQILANPAGASIRLVPEYGACYKLRICRRGAKDGRRPD